MSTLRSRIKQSIILKKEMVASTIRMPKELHSFVDELAEYLSLSRQEVLLDLIKEGASVAREELDPGPLNAIQDEFTFHLLNTNRGNNDEDHFKMIEEGVAAAFYDPWKRNINRIKEGDTVFLYENGVGVVAFGIGTGNTLSRDHEGQTNECYYQKLRDFNLILTPITASEIKKILNRNVVFLRTMSGMPDGQKLLDRIHLQKND